MNEDFSIMRYIHHQEEVMHLCREVMNCRYCASTSKSVEALVSAALVAVPSQPGCVGRRPKCVPSTSCTAIDTVSWECVLVYVLTGDPNSGAPSVRSMRVD